MLLLINIIFIFSQQNHEASIIRYVLIVEATIRTPAVCREKQQNCQTQTINNIKDLQMPHVIVENDGCTRLIQFSKPTVSILIITSRQTTTIGKLNSL